MRRLYVLGFVLLLASNVQSQWLEQTVWLPDSIVGLEEPSRILFNPINHHAYIGGSESDLLQIFDYATREKVGFIDSLGPTTDMFMCPDRQRVYILGPDWGGVFTLDAQTDSVLRFVDLSTEPACGVYNPQEQKAYVGAWADAALFVLDPGPDTLLTVIQLADEVIRIAYDSVTNRVFGMAHDGSTHGIKVIDCAGDTLVGVLPTMDDYCVDLAFNPATRRLYCLGKSFTTELAEVWVYDVDALSLLDTIALPESWYSIDGRLLLNPAAGRLYVGYMSTERTDDPEDSLAVIDCSTNVITGLIGLPDGSEVRNWALNRADNKVYICTWDLDSVAVLGAPDSITGWVRTGSPVSSVGWNPANDELLMPDDNDFLTVVSGANDSILARIDYRGFSPYGLVWTAAGDKLYAFEARRVAVIGPANTIVKWVEPQDFRVRCAPAYSAELNRAYVHDGGDKLWVFDCNTDSFIRSESLPIMPELYYPPFLVPGFHKLYVPSNSNSAVVYDIYADSVTGVKPGMGDAFVYNPRSGLVYGHSYYAPGIRVIDPRQDSVVENIWSGVVSDLAVNSTGNELYALDAYGPSLYVVDGANNTLTDTIQLPGPARQLAWYEPLDKLYALGDSAIYVVDCRTHQVTRTLAVVTSGYVRPVFAARNDKLWVSGGYWPAESTYVIQCRADSVVATFPGRSYVDMAWNPIDNRVYVAPYDRVIVFRDDLTGVEEMPQATALRFGLKPGSNPASGMVAFDCVLPGGEPGRLTVYDATGRLVWTSGVATGRNAVIWPATDRQGRQVPSGVYLARLESGAKRSTAKVVLR